MCTHNILADLLIKAAPAPRNQAFRAALGLEKDKTWGGALEDGF